MIKRTIQQDATEACIYSPVEVTIDDEGDVWLLSDDGTLMFSLAQAYTLAAQLGQALIEFQRSWGARDLHASTKAIAND